LASVSGSVSVSVSASGSASASSSVSASDSGSGSGSASVSASDSRSDSVSGSDSGSAWGSASAPAFGERPLPVRLRSYTPFGVFSPRGMALIRVTEEWLRSPAAASPTRTRSVMVVADTWAEQKVLMRAYASSEDQTRPAIVLNGSALAIGPASADPHGPWGIHVDHGSEGRAQELRDLLKQSARRVAGTKGNPPRLADEVSDFDKRQTNLWAPGGARDRESQGPASATPQEPVAPAPATRAGRSPFTQTPQRGIAPAPARAPARSAEPATMVGRADAAQRNPSGVISSAQRPKPGTLPPPAMVPRTRPPTAPPTNQVFRSAPGARTVSPFGPHAPAGGPPPPAPRRRPSTARFKRATTPVPVMAPLGQIVGRTMPLGFSLEPLERTVLNEIGSRGRLTARQIADIVGEADGLAWMEGLMRKLADHGLDIVEPGDDDRGEPTYVLRR